MNMNYYDLEKQKQKELQNEFETNYELNKKSLILNLCVGIPFSPILNS